MARVVYDKATAFGGLLELHVANIVKARNDMARIIGVANALTAGGTVPAGLEASKEFGVSAGQGLNFYNDLQSIIAGLNAITILYELDQG